MKVRNLILMVVCLSVLAVPVGAQNETSTSGTSSVTCEGLGQPAVEEFCGVEVGEDTITLKVRSEYSHEVNVGVFDPDESGARGYVTWRLQSGMNEKAFNAPRGEIVFFVGGVNGYYFGEARSFWELFEEQPSWSELIAVLLSAMAASMACLGIVALKKLRGSEDWIIELA